MDNEAYNDLVVENSGSIYHYSESEEIMEEMEYEDQGDWVTEEYYN